MIGIPFYTEWCLFNFKCDWDGGGARRAFAGMQASTDSDDAAPFVQAYAASMFVIVRRTPTHHCPSAAPFKGKCVPMAPFHPRHARTLLLGAVVRGCRCTRREVWFCRHPRVFNPAHLGIDFRVEILSKSHPRATFSPHIPSQLTNTRSSHEPWLST